MDEKKFQYLMLLSCVIFTLVLSDSWDSILENEYDIIKIIRLDMKLLSDEERNEWCLRCLIRKKGCYPISQLRALLYWLTYVGRSHLKAYFWFSLPVSVEAAFISVYIVPGSSIWRNMWWMRKCVNVWRGLLVLWFFGF